MCVCVCDQLVEHREELKLRSQEAICPTHTLLPWATGLAPECCSVPATQRGAIINNPCPLWVYGAKSSQSHQLLLPHRLTL